MSDSTAFFMIFKCDLNAMPMITGSVCRECRGLGIMIFQDFCMVCMQFSFLGNEFCVFFIMRAWFWYIFIILLTCLYKLGHYEVGLSRFSRFGDPAGAIFVISKRCYCKNFIKQSWSRWGSNSIFVVLKYFVCKLGDCGASLSRVSVFWGPLVGDVG